MLDPLQQTSHGVDNARLGLTPADLKLPLATWSGESYTVGQMVHDFAAAPVNERPSLAKHCVSIARSLGRAAVRMYGPTRAQSYARPVCDTSFAGGVTAAQS